MPIFSQPSTTFMFTLCKKVVFEIEKKACCCNRNWNLSADNYKKLLTSAILRPLDPNIGNGDTPPPYKMHTS